MSHNNTQLLFTKTFDTMGYIALSPASRLPANDLKTDVINELIKLEANLLPLMLLKA